MELNFERMPYAVYKKELLKQLKPSWKKNLLEAYKYVNGDNDYLLRVIDGEAVVYRDLGDYDIEDQDYAKEEGHSVYIFGVKNPLTIVHKVHQIKELEQLKIELDTIMYQVKRDDMKEWGMRYANPVQGWDETNNKTNRSN